MIDYERMKRVFPKQKAALTSAKKKGYAAVLATCKSTVKKWDAIEVTVWYTPEEHGRMFGSIWNIALGDAAYTQAQTTREWPEVMRLEQLQ